jgi:uncharacterized protein (DUF2344 family)
MIEVKSANLKINFKEGFNLSPELSAEEALHAVLSGLKNGDAKEVNIAVEFSHETITEEMEEVEVE